jgi:hypothetical protein
MADPISKLENDIRRASARLKCDPTARFGCSILQYFAVLQHFSSIRTRLNNRRIPALGSGPTPARPSRERGAIIKPGVRTPHHSHFRAQRPRPTFTTLRRIA